MDVITKGKAGVSRGLWACCGGTQGSTGLHSMEEGPRHHPDLRLCNEGDPGCGAPGLLVAGVGFEPTTFGL